MDEQILKELNKINRSLDFFKFVIVIYIILTIIGACGAFTWLLN